MIGGRQGTAGSSEATGATTATSGTPFAVDVSGDRRDRLELLVFLAGPLIWAAHFFAVYLVAEAGCTGAGVGLSALDDPVPRVTTLVATAVACLGCLAAAAWARRRRRVAGAGLGGDGQDRTLGFAGQLLSLFSFVAVLSVGAPAAFLGPC